MARGGKHHVHFQPVRGCGAVSTCRTGACPVQCNAPYLAPPCGHHPSILRSSTMARCLLSPATQGRVLQPTPEPGPPPNATYVRRTRSRSWRLPATAARGRRTALSTREPARTAASPRGTACRTPGTGARRRRPLRVRTALGTLHRVVLGSNFRLQICLGGLLAAAAWCIVGRQP